MPAYSYYACAVGLEEEVLINKAIPHHIGGEFCLRNLLRLAVYFQQPLVEFVGGNRLRVEKSLCRVAAALT